MYGARQVTTHKCRVTIYNSEGRADVCRRVCLKGQDIFVSVPTGFGKSLIFQILPFSTEFLTKLTMPSKPVVLIVLPLLSPMDNQVAKLTSKGIQAISVFGKHDTDHLLYKEVVEGLVAHVYGSPEAFLGNAKWHCLLVDPSAGFKEHVVSIVIDGAHCIMKSFFKTK